MMIIPLYLSTGKFGKVGRIFEKSSQKVYKSAPYSNALKHLSHYYRENSVLDNDFERFLSEIEMFSVMPKSVCDILYDIPTI